MKRILFLLLIPFILYGQVERSSSGGVAEIDTTKIATINHVQELIDNIIQPDSIFLGTSYFPTANYTGTNDKTLIQSNIGTAVSPESSQDAAVIIQKITNNTGITGVNSASYISIKKKAAGALSRATAGFFEAQDDIGGATSFVEGIRSHGVLMSDDEGSGEAFGIVTMAGTEDNINYKYLVGIESDVYNNSGSNAGLIFDKDKFTVGFLASANGNYTADAGFATNPYTGKTFREGFLVTEGSVSTAAFRSFANVTFALDARTANSNANLPAIITRHSRGTIASPTATQQFDALMSLQGSGYDTTWQTGKAEIKFAAADTWTSSSNPTYITLSTTPIGSKTKVDRISILNDGILYFHTLPPTYVDNATAKAGGLSQGMVYKTSTGQLMVVYD